MSPLTCPPDCPYCASKACRACVAEPNVDCQHSAIERHQGRPAISRTTTPTTPLASPIEVVEIVFSDPEAAARDLERIVAIIRAKGRILIA